jgi:hypothetical protein
MRDGTAINRERMMRHTKAPIGQRQLVRFYRGADGEPWVEVSHEHDRTNVIRHRATEADRERWVEEFEAFEAAEAAGVQP